MAENNAKMLKEVRIEGYNLPLNKRVEIALTYIYGVGKSRAKKLCLESEIDPNIKLYQLTENDINRIRAAIQEFEVGDELKRNKALIIKELKDLGSYRGLRHRKNLPVRGQRTHTNARTRKGKSKPIANKKKA